MLNSSILTMLVEGKFASAISAPPNVDFLSLQSFTRQEPQIRGPLKPIITAARTHMAKMNDRISRSEAIAFALRELPSLSPQKRYQQIRSMASIPLTGTFDVETPEMFLTEPLLQPIDEALAFDLEHANGNSSYPYDKATRATMLAIWFLNDRITKDDRANTDAQLREQLGRRSATRKQINAVIADGSISPIHDQIVRENLQRNLGIPNEHLVFSI